MNGMVSIHMCCVCLCVCVAAQARRHTRTVSESRLAAGDLPPEAIDTDIAMTEVKTSSPTNTGGVSPNGNGGTAELLP
jgi:hypothetical protein